MAFGQHWEWRGFGRVSDDLRNRIESLDFLYAYDQPLVDSYLWTSACPVNVKLRFGDLKFKRLIAEEGHLRHWLEDENDIYPFPLDGDIVDELERALAVTLFSKPRGPVERSELVPLLQFAQPPVKILIVEKCRRFFSLPISVGTAVIIELSDIIRPEPISTVACEHAEIEAVRQALAQLGLPDSDLRSLDYLQALSIWATGQHLLCS